MSDYRKKTFCCDVDRTGCKVIATSFPGDRIHFHVFDRDEESAVIVLTPDNIKAILAMVEKKEGDK